MYVEVPYFILCTDLNYIFLYRKHYYKGYVLICNKHFFIVHNKRFIIFFNLEFQINFVNTSIVETNIGKDT